MVLCDDLLSLFDCSLQLRIASRSSFLPELLQVFLVVLPHVPDVLLVEVRAREPVQLVNLRFVSGLHVGGWRYAHSVRKRLQVVVQDGVIGHHLLTECLHLRVRRLLRSQLSQLDLCHTALRSFLQEHLVLHHPGVGVCTRSC